MTHASASTFCVWSVLSTALGAFLLGHLWRFDRFKCLRWSNTPYSGAFKRIMTYTYLITIPLIMIYSFGFAYIKYHEGFLDIEGQIIVKPYTFWSSDYRRAIFPLMLIFSLAWSLEMITHLEELCFWLFLISARQQQTDWFKSIFFRVWMVGSIGAFIYVPIVTTVNRHDPLACEARTFTAGSVGDLVLTVAFIPILWSFPNFLQKVKAEGVDSSIIIRLRKFYELNIIRIIFRFLMHIPLLALGADGLRPHQHLNESMFWTDLLSIIAGLGCVFSSACTLLIFFPRSYEAEYQAIEASRARSMHTHSSRQSGFSYPSQAQYDGYTRRGSVTSHGASVSQNRRAQRILRLPLKRHSEPGDTLPDQRRTTPTARANTAPVKATHPQLDERDEEANAFGAVLSHSNTYLLTDSPVLRAQALALQRAREAERLDKLDLENDPLDLEGTETYERKRTRVTTNSHSHLQGSRPLPLPSKSPAPGYYSSSEREDEYKRWADADAKDSGDDSGTEYGIVQVGTTVKHTVALPELRSAPAAPPVHSYGRQSFKRKESGPAGPRALRALPEVPGSTTENGNAGPLTSANVQWHNGRQSGSQINPLVHTFTSPIDLMERRHRELPITPYSAQWPGFGV
ncbi:hypothetical protein M0805_004762 [Coniferiporia weirii]|nr:hypothetical protein M0805_004762 [Coniferiporia weirii]